jgi:hypothetical protein
VTLLYCSKNNVLPCYDPSTNPAANCNRCTVKKTRSGEGGRWERENVYFQVMIVNYRILYYLWWDSFIDADPVRGEGMNKRN